LLLKIKIQIGHSGTNGFEVFRITKYIFAAVRQRKSGVDSIAWRTKPTGKMR
jgi:hypothetical protein